LILSLLDLPVSLISVDCVAFTGSPDGHAVFFVVVVLLISVQGTHDSFVAGVRAG